MGRLSKRCACRDTFNGPAQAEPQKVCLECQPGLFNEQMPQAAWRQSTDSDGVGQPDRRVYLLCGPRDELADARIRFNRDRIPRQRRDQFATKGHQRRVASHGAAIGGRDPFAQIAEELRSDCGKFCPVEQPTRHRPPKTALGFDKDKSHKAFWRKRMFDVSGNRRRFAANVGALGVQAEMAIQRERHLDGVMSMKVSSLGPALIDGRCIDDPQAGALPYQDLRLRQQFHVSQIIRKTLNAQASAQARFLRAILFLRGLSRGEIRTAMTGAIRPGGDVSMRAGAANRLTRSNHYCFGLAGADRAAFSAAATVKRVASVW